jgi:hypothetical protein
MDFEVMTNSSNSATFRDFSEGFTICMSIQFLIQGRDTGRKDNVTFGA